MAEVILETNTSLLNATDNCGNSSLISAIRYQNIPFSLEILRYLPDLSASGEGDRTALHWACFHGLVEIVREIVKQAESNLNVIDAQDCLGDSPVILAAQNKVNGSHDSIIEMLLKSGCNVKVQGQHGRALLHWIAIHGCNESTLSSLLGCDLDINSVDQDGNSSLILAVANRNHDLVSHLIEFQSCDVNLRGADGKSALHWACLRGNLEVVQNILDTNRCDLDLQDNEGNSSLILCAEYKSIKCFSELMKHNADVNLVNTKNRCALHWVAEAGQDCHNGRCVHVVCRVSSNLVCFNDTLLIELNNYF